MNALPHSALAVVLLLTTACAAHQDPWQDPKRPLELRLETLIANLTDDEKLDLLSGVGWMETRANARLGIPSIHMANGPSGIRSWASPTDPDTPETPKIVHATEFPSGIAMAATWDPRLVEEEGKTIADEALALGRDQILGPTVDIARNPLAGRNFEGYGEDPWLASRMAIAFVRGVQGEGVIATVGHFGAASQENARTTLDAKIDERTLHEIYLPAFKAAVEEAGVWSVLSSRNKVNGAWAAENTALLTDILRKQWGFRGFVVSGWAGTHSTAGSLNAGLDLEMPGGNPAFAGYLTREKLKPLLASGQPGGQFDKESLDDRVRRLLRPMFIMGMFDRRRQTPGDVDTPGRRAIAQTAALESIVLLKNEGAILPLDPRRTPSIAVIGPTAMAKSNPLDAIRRRAGSVVEVGFAPGLAENLKAAVELARRSSVAIVFAGTSPDPAAEIPDRESLDLPEGQDALIQAVTAANPHTIVVLNAGSPIAAGRWLARTPALLDAWFPGEEGGQAIAAVLFGDFNPSGKLPVTFPKDLKDTPAFGRHSAEQDTVDYSEGLYVGYRHYDKRNVEPLFPFGHGLSYTAFEYSDLNIQPKTPRYSQVVQVFVKVRNTGSRPGAEVVQLYVHQVKSSADRPAKELKAFRRVELAPGEEKTVTLDLGRGAMSFYDPAAKDWAAEPGRFEVLVGSSSRDIRLKGAFELFE